MKLFEYVIRSSHPLRQASVARGESDLFGIPVIFQAGEDLRPGRLGAQRLLAVVSAEEVEV